MIPSHEWMGKSSNVEIDEKKLNAKTLAFVVAMSEDKGLVAIETFARSLDKDDFIEFLKKIRKCYGVQKIGLYLDNASFHTANKVKDYARKNDIDLIFAPVYSPEFNPSESLIGYLKQHIKKKRLQNIIEDKEQTYEQMLKEAKKRVTNKMCVSMINNSLNKLNKA